MRLALNFRNALGNAKIRLPFLLNPLEEMHTGGATQVRPINPCSEAARTCGFSRIAHNRVAHPGMLLRFCGRQNIHPRRPYEVSILPVKYF